MKAGARLASDSHGQEHDAVQTYPVSVGTVAFGCSSPVPSSSERFHNSRHVSLLKSTSTAPDLVPVTIQGVAEEIGDQAKAAVR